MNKIKKIQIESVDFSTMTFLSVECSEFEKYFKEYRTISITNLKIINEFLRYFGKLEPIDSTYSKAVDTRAKVKLFTEADTSIICIGNLTLHMNENIYKTPQELIDFIENLE
jgi:hypothetical protein